MQVLQICVYDGLFLQEKSIWDAVTEHCWDHFHLQTFNAGFAFLSAENEDCQWALEAYGSIVEPKLLITDPPNHRPRACAHECH